MTIYLKVDSNLFHDRPIYGVEKYTTSLVLTVPTWRGELAYDNTETVAQTSRSFVRTINVLQKFG